MTSRRLENRNHSRKQHLTWSFSGSDEGRSTANLASRHPSLSPSQPELLFHQSSTTTSFDPPYKCMMLDKDIRRGESKRICIRAANSSPVSTSEIVRRKGRQEHNLRERDRRRGESIIYELIRTCLSEEDIHLHLPGVNRTPENLSYHQILRISAELVKNEPHEMDAFSHHKLIVKILEEACHKLGVALPENRPFVIPPMEKHRRYAKIVKEGLRTDRCRMRQNAGGDGEGLLTPREVALAMDERLRESDRLFTRESRKRSSNYHEHPPKHHQPSLANVPPPHSSPCQVVTNAQNDFPFTDRKPPCGAKDPPSDFRISLQFNSAETIHPSPALDFHSPLSSTARHQDRQRQAESKSEGVADVASSDSVFTFPLLSPSAGVDLGIETEPLFHLLSTKFDIDNVDT